MDDEMLLEMFADYYEGQFKNVKQSNILAFLDYFQYDSKHNRNLLALFCMNFKFDKTIQLKTIREWLKNNKVA